MENDPIGTRSRGLQHIYCNPYNTTICTVLTLFTYFLVTSPSTDTHLFPGLFEYNQYTKYLKNLLESKREYVMEIMV